MLLHQKWKMLVGRKWRACRLWGSQACRGWWETRWASSPGVHAVQHQSQHLLTGLGRWAPFLVHSDIREVDAWHGLCVQHHQQALPDTHVMCLWWESQEYCSVPHPKGWASNSMGFTWSNLPSLHFASYSLPAYFQNSIRVFPCQPVLGSADPRGSWVLLLSPALADPGGYPTVLQEHGCKTQGTAL